MKLLTAISLFVLVSYAQATSLCPTGIEETVKCEAKDTIALFPYVALCGDNLIALDRGSFSRPETYEVEKNESDKAFKWIALDPEESDQLSFTLQKDPSLKYNGLLRFQFITGFKLEYACKVSSY